MGFLSKAFKRVKKQIQPNNMMIGSLPKRPRRGGGFLSKIRNKAFDRIESGKIPARSGFLRGQYFGPRGNMGSDFRMPQKRGGFGFGLGEAIRRQRGGNLGSDFRAPRMPRMEGSIPRIPGGMFSPGGTPGFYDNMRENMSPGQRLEQMPQPIPRAERMPVSNAPSFNPTIFGQPIGDMDFSQMPKISLEDMMNLQVPTQMPMTQDLPEVAPVGMMAGRTLQQDFPAEPRMMMQAGEEVSLERELFSLQSQLENLQEQLRMDRSYNDDQAVIDTSAQMAAIQKRMQEILQESGRTISDMDRQMGFKAAGSIGLDDQGNPVFPEYAEGGEAFPDLSGDGETTFKDVLIGRGVDLKAEGGEMMTQENEIDAMLGGMDSEESGAMEDLEQMAPEMEMIDQLVTMVVQMIQQGASEEEVMMFLREQGLDDEDIGTVLQLVAEMAEAEAMPQDGIGAELEQLA